MSVSYENDYCAWAETNANLLRQGKWAEVDVAHLIEELDDVGKSERRSLESFVGNVLMHLLKWRFQPGLCGTSWRRSIRNGRREAAKVLRDSPSLRPLLPQIVAAEYPAAREDAADETGLPLETFPQDCPFSLEQVLAEDFWP